MSASRSILKPFDTVFRPVRKCLSFVFGHGYIDASGNSNPPGNVCLRDRSGKSGRSLQKDRLDSFRDRIRHLCNVEYFGENDRKTIMRVGNDWSLRGENVRFAKNHMDNETSDMSVLNCVMGENSRIPPHYHENVETIYVVGGSYTDPVTGRIYRAGETQTIPAGSIHSLLSDHALLLMMWRPPFGVRPGDGFDGKNAEQYDFALESADKQ